MGLKEKINRMNKVNLTEKFSLFSDFSSPKIAGELNGHHETEDELFYVVKGSFDMHFRDKIVTVNEGEFLIVPHGVEHKPVANEEVHIMLFEPATTLNTGNTVNEKTVNELDRI
jgi:mannose-6-phosphate isomerase-like protein (cupin superfamily)